ncbi:MAG: helix-turn-helix transcriptional regulator [Blastocatellia bacterium]
MSKQGTNSLAEFVARVLKEKRLTLQDVQVMSGWTITSAYVGSIIRGIASNPSVEKLQALARGLGVDEDEIFRVARGLAPGGSLGHGTPDPEQPVVILRLMAQVMSQPDVIEILREIVRLSEEDRAVVLSSAKSLIKSRKAGRRKAL